jgi:spermidine/putrescine transport system ATP-binding protein
VSRANHNRQAGEPLLKFLNVEKRFGDTLAVRNVNLDIGRGDFVAIMGPSGCGKTTMLRMLAGLERPTAGSILRDGVAIDGVPPWLRRMPLVWQNYALFPFLNVLDNVAFGLRNDNVAKQERQRRSMEWLERLGIANLAQRSPATLSGGQAQRVALARALVLEPDVLLLDEPLSALDANMVVRMQSELAELQRALGITFVYVTHNQSEAFAMADHVVIMNEGEVQQVGSPLDVYRTPKTRFVAEFVGTNNIIDGVVKAVAKGKCVVETALGTFTSSNPSNAPAAIGRDVHLIVSADMLAVNRKRAANATNAVAAHLVGESFAGNIVTLVLETAGGFEFKVQVQQRALQGLNIQANDKVILTFARRDTLLIPSLQAGLAQTGDSK